MEIVESPIVIDYAIIDHTPVLYTAINADPDLKRVTGYEEHGFVACMFPAFTPIVADVLSDLDLLFGDRINFTSRAQRFVTGLQKDAQNYAMQRFPTAMKFVLPPYAHQKRTMLDAYYNFRWYLGLDMGLGKTKIIIDLIRMLKQMGKSHKALIVVPPHLVTNWIREVEKHTFFGELTAGHTVDRQNKPIPPTDREAIYRNTARDVYCDAPHVVAIHPFMIYEPLPPGLDAPGVYELETELLHAIVARDTKKKASITGKIDRRLKKIGAVRPKGRWRCEDNPPVHACEADVFITSYSILCADKDMIIEYVDYDVFVLDEAHYIRGYGSDRSKACLAAAKKANRRLPMSGSPTAGNPMNLYRPLEMLCPVYVEDYYAFKTRYVVPTYNSGRGDQGYKNMHILNDIMARTSTMLHTEDCMGVDLPPLNVIDVPVALDHETLARYNEVVSSWSFWFPDDNATMEIQYGAERLTKLLQLLSGFIVNSGKDPAICDGCPFLHECVEEGYKPYSKHCKVEQKAPKHEIVRIGSQPKQAMFEGYLADITLNDPTNKIIVWCVFNEEIERVKESLNKYEIEHAVVTGATTDVQAERDRFESDPDCRVYVSNVSISEGFTLNAANFAIYYGIPWDIISYQQSIKRNHRIGQGRPVTVYRLFSPDTVHVGVIHALNTKRDVNKSLCDVIRCSACPQFTQCQEEGIQPFDKGCVYASKINKKTIKPKLLKGVSDVEP